MGPKLNGGRGMKVDLISTVPLSICIITWADYISSLNLASLICKMLIICLIFLKKIRNAGSIHFTLSSFCIWDSFPAQNPLRSWCWRSIQKDPWTCNTTASEHNFSVLPQGQLLTPTLVHCGRETRSQFGTAGSGSELSPTLEDPKHHHGSPAREKAWCLQRRMKPCSGTRSQQLYETEEARLGSIQRKDRGRHLQRDSGGRPRLGLEPGWNFVPDENRRRGGVGREGNGASHAEPLRGTLRPDWLLQSVGSQKGFWRGGDMWTYYRSERSFQQRCER